MTDTGGMKGLPNDETKSKTIAIKLKITSDISGSESTIHFHFIVVLLCPECETEAASMEKTRV